MSVSYFRNGKFNYLSKEGKTSFAFSSLFFLSFPLSTELTHQKYHGLLTNFTTAHIKIFCSSGVT